MTEFIISIASMAIGVFLGQYLSKLKFERATSTLVERQRISDEQKSVLENKLLMAASDLEKIKNNLL